MDPKTRKLVISNAIALCLATLASFALPLVMESLTDGDAKFLRALSHVFPLFVIIPFSCQLIIKAARHAPVQKAA